MTAIPVAIRVSRQRWLQLTLGIVCMAMIANLQYGWTLFVNPIDAKYHWGRAAIQVAFSIFVLTETWLVPVEGWFVDRYGPQAVVLFGGVMVGAAWMMNAVASSLSLLYLAAAVGGIGAGAVYGTCIGNALKWFSDLRGLVAGLTAAGFGAGSALTIIPIQSMIAAGGYEARPRTVQPAGRQYTPIEVVRSPLFWIMYVMFVLVGAGGLMATAQLAPIAKDFNVDTVPVTLLGITLPALTFALSLDRVLNGVTRPFFGWVSDNLGRENTMLIAFSLEAFGIWLLSLFGENPTIFVLLSGLVFFAWGEIYSLFPSTCTDAYGTRYATTNAGLLYTAKGTAALLVPWGKCAGDNDR